MPVTPKFSIRIPPARWKAVQARAAGVHQAAAATVVNAFLAQYAAGMLDDAVAGWVAALKDTHSDAQPGEASGTSSGHSPHSAHAST